MMYRGRSGISPVVATVILVAIAIVIAIAVAFWATGLVTIFTRYEKLEITSAYAILQGDGTYSIVIMAKNTGSSPATIDAIHLNGVPVCTTQGPTGVTPPGLTGPPQCPQLPVALEPGQDITQNPLQVTGVQPHNPGVTVEVALHTASGKLYPYSVLLP